MEKGGGSESGEALKGSDGWGGEGMPKEIMAAQGSRSNHRSRSAPQIHT